MVASWIKWRFDDVLLWLDAACCTAVVCIYLRGLCSTARNPLGLSAAWCFIRTPISVRPVMGSRNNLTGPLDNALGSSVAWAYCDVPICGTVTYDCQYMEVRARWKPSHSVIAENMVIMRPYRKQI